MKRTTEKYGRLAQALHWISALLIIILWPMGFAMVRMADNATKTRLYQAHVAIGLIILILTIVRVIWHFMDTVPDLPEGLTPMNGKAFRWTHNLLYVFLLLMASSGIAMLLSSELGLLPGAVTPEAIADVPPRAGHSLFSKIFMLLFLAHVGGVVRHQLTKGNTLARMGVPISRP